MTSASHALIGATVAYTIPNPSLGLPLAFFSHFIADIIPHWDFAYGRRPKTRRRIFFEAAIDVVFGFIVVWYIFHKLPVEPVYLFAAIITAQLPDWLDTFLPTVLNYQGFPVKLIDSFQRRFHWKLGLPWGLVTQLVLILGLLVIFGIVPSPNFHLLAQFY